MTGVQTCALPISEAIAGFNEGCELVLTHTHAGVDILRRRLKSMGVPTSAFHIETIAGFALRYAASFPSSSGLGVVNPSGDQWNETYGAATQLLRNTPIKQVLSATYSGVYVDEYQDCTIQQHELVMELAELLPCRILGDPLQGIFDFGNNELVDWQRDIDPFFEPLPDLEIPWRWERHNRALGAWLLEVRESLLSGEGVDFRGAPVKWWKLPAKNAAIEQVKACYSVKAKPGETIVAIQNLPYQCHLTASRLRGRYSCVEPIDCADLLNGAENIQSVIGGARVQALLHFASKCFTAVEPGLRKSTLALIEGKLQAGRRYKNQEQLDALREVLENESLTPVLVALDSLKKFPDAVLYRRELFFEMKKTLREYLQCEHQSLKDAAWHVRNITSRTGRHVAGHTMGRTLLVKGLEFDHAIILGSDELSLRNLYVAMTRGAKSLTILSKEPFWAPV